jgi:hypothetical protein
VTSVQATFQNDLEGLFSSAELHRRSVAVVGPFKRSHYREAAKLAYTDFYCYNPDSQNYRVRLEVAGDTS